MQHTATLSLSLPPRSDDAPAPPAAVNRFLPHLVDQLDALPRVLARRGGFVLPRTTLAD